MSAQKLYNSWISYTNYVRTVILPNNNQSQNDIAYWQNEIFFNSLTILLPISIIALVPGVFISFTSGIALLGSVDLMAFGLLALIMTNRSMSLKLRKSVFIGLFYCLSFALLYYLGRTGPGLLFLLATTIFTSAIYSSAAGLYSAWVNLLICICFGILIYLKLNSAIANEYSIGSWIAVSSNLVLLSFVCAGCINLLLKGLKTSLHGSKTLSANLNAIIESSDAFIYSLDADFRFMTINQVMKNRLKLAFNVDIKIGDNAFEFLQNIAPDEAHFWKSVYTETLTGKPVKFERDANFGGSISTTSFSFCPIVDYNKVTGISCFGTDITDAKNAKHQIQKLNDELEIKVVERTVQLQASNKELEAFSYSVSHDLRAPLRAVIGYSQMLREDFGPELGTEATRIINNIMNHGKKMGQLIDDLLTFSRLGRKELRKESIHVQEMVESICIEIKEANSIRDIQFMISNLVPAHGDKVAINQVWVNLISNAVKYTKTKEQALIEIGSEINADELIYYIKDNGAGFDMRYADKLFGVFQRLHSDEEFEGTGVGLATVHRIVSKHDGRLWAEAEVDIGASFYFALPLNT